MLFGVCAGIAEYFDTDPTLVRLLTVALALFVPGVIFLYLVAALIMPRCDEPP